MPRPLDNPDTIQAMLEADLYEMFVVAKDAVKADIYVWRKIVTNWNQGVYKCCIPTKFKCLYYDGLILFARMK